MEPNRGPVGVPGVDQLTAEAPEDLTDVHVGPIPDGTAVIEFADFFRQSRTGLVRAVAVTVGDRDLAVEAVDEAFARAYHDGRGSGSCRARGDGCSRVALNWATSVLRRRRRAPQPLGERDPCDIGPIGEPDVLVALAELDVRQRAVVVCRHLLGWSEAETAHALGIPAGTVKSRLHRATQHLATRLDHLRPDHLRGDGTEDHR